MQWEKRGQDFNGAEWHDMKKTETIKYWHDKTIDSTQFEPLKMYQVDASNQPTFEEVENEEDRKECKEVYKENMIYYKSFLSKINS